MPNIAKRKRLTVRQMVANKERGLTHDGKKTKSKHRHPRTMPDRIRLGEFCIGNRPFLLFAIPALAGGSVEWFPQRNESIGEICIGLDREHWEDVLAVAVHETMETAIAEVGCRFKPTPDYAYASDGFVFHMDHNHFSEACARAANFLAGGVPKLLDAYQKYGPSAKRDS